MSRVHVSLVVPPIALLALACRPDADAGPPTAPEPLTATTPSTPPGPLAEPALGTAGDLRARGAFRAEASKGAKSELSDRWLTLTVQTQAADGSWWALGAGGQLRTGEVLVTEVELRQPAHIYVINVSASGKSVLLYPSVQSGDVDALLGVGMHRLPPARSELPYIELDDEIGTEHLFIVATPEPIARVDRELAGLVTKLLRGESPSLTDPGDATSRQGSRPHGTNQPRKSWAKKPRASGSSWTQAEIDEALASANVGATPEMRTRGTFRSRADGAAVDAKAGDDGVVVIPFRFEHI